MYSWWIGERLSFLYGDCSLCTSLTHGPWLSAFYNLVLPLACINLSTWLFLFLFRYGKLKQLTKSFQSVFHFDLCEILFFFLVYCTDLKQVFASYLFMVLLWQFD